MKRVNRPILPVEILNPRPKRPKLSYALFPVKPALNAFSAISTERLGPLSATLRNSALLFISTNLGNSIETRGFAIGGPWIFQLVHRGNLVVAWVYRLKQSILLDLELNQNMAL